MLFTVGAFFFGLVIGWVTYRTLRRSQSKGVSDIAAVVGAVGGAAVTTLFRPQTDAFGMYSIGLAVGFFGYLASGILLTSHLHRLSALAEWLGDLPHIATGSEGKQAEMEARSGSSQVSGQVTPQEKLPEL